MLKGELALSEEQTSDGNSRGIILDLSSSAADSTCIKLYIGTVNTKGTSEIKLTATLMCKSISMFYSTYFKLVHDNRTGHLQCIRPYYERTDSCTSFPENRLRLTANDSSFVVENVDPDGELIGRSSFLTQNESENWVPRCNCRAFESMLQRYDECVWKLHTKRDPLVVAQLNMAYGVAAIFVTIFVITVLPLILLQLKILAATSFEPACVLADCSMPSSDPNLANCPVELLERSRLFRHQKQSPQTNSQGSILSVSNSVANPDCLQLSTVISENQTKLSVIVECAVNEDGSSSSFTFIFELIWSPLREQIKCLLPHRNNTNACTQDRIALSVFDSGIMVGDFNRTGARVGRREHSLKRKKSMM
ncbi:hypothetical protein pipiens_011000 [Culex pipiens pipiens]|uniref:Uncharacterized protein n=1 Tax=Culex pipiens pipiens TaxID=38569 RepID=A0ABD1D7Z4_CULPP